MLEVAIPRRRIQILLLLTLLAGVLLTVPVGAKESSTPPVLDRELFFGDPEISGAQISPNGEFIAFIKPLKGTRNIWVKRTSEPFDAAPPITCRQKRSSPSWWFPKRPPSARGVAGNTHA